MERKEQIKQAAYESLCGDKSYVSSYEEKGFINGAEWSDENPNPELKKQWIDKACNWLYEHAWDYFIDKLKYGEGCDFLSDKMICELRKYMEE